VKKYLPFILLGVGVLVLVGVVFFVRGMGKDAVVEEEKVAEIPFELRPVASLTPSEDGHWLNMVIEKIVFDAASMDYELLYNLPDGRSQGVPGTIKLDGQDAIERDLLLGSESSGKFRYDEGVEAGTLTIRFRNEKGKLTGKLVTDFVLLTDVSDVESSDGNFTYKFTDPQDGVYYVVMGTFGVPSDPPSVVQSGPYGLFSSLDDEDDAELLTGTAEVKGYTPYLHLSADEWVMHGKDSLLESASNIFVGLGE
jgi:hypothetical protein